MARLQGNRQKWWETGVYELDFVKDSGAWRIQRVLYRSARIADIDHAELDLPGVS
jgi:hypothetical protein